LLLPGCETAGPAVTGRPVTDGGDALQRWVDEATVITDDSSLLVAARAGSAHGQPALAFTVRNVGAAPIRVREMDLPWGHESVVSVVGVMSDGRVIAFPEFFSDPGPSNPMVVVEAGQTISGTRVLGSERLSSELRRRDVIVLWRYRPLGATPISSSDGVVVFHKHAG
jgi:hypothetical protein